MSTDQAEPVQEARPVKHNPTKKERRALTRRAVRLYASGLALTRVAEEMGWSYGFVRKLLIDAGVERRAEGRPKTQQPAQKAR